MNKPRTLRRRLLAGLCAFCLVALQCFVLTAVLPEKVYAADNLNIDVKVDSDENKAKVKEDVSALLKDSNNIVQIYKKGENPEDPEALSEPIDAIRLSTLKEDFVNRFDETIDFDFDDKDISDPEKVVIVPKDSGDKFDLYWIGDDGVVNNSKEINKLVLKTKSDYNPIKKVTINGSPEIKLDSTGKGTVEISYDAEWKKPFSKDENSDDKFIAWKATYSDENAVKIENGYITVTVSGDTLPAGNIAFWAEDPLTGNKLTEADGSATVKQEDQTFTITFKDAVTGNILLTQVVKKGENATPPTPVESQTKDGKTYTFKGWDSTKYEKVTADATILATYETVETPDPKPAADDGKVKGDDQNLSTDTGENDDDPGIGEGKVKGDKSGRVKSGGIARPTVKATTKATTPTTATRPPTTTVKPSYRKIKVKEVTLGEVLAETPEESEEFIEEEFGDDSEYEEDAWEDESGWDGFDFGPAAGSAAMAMACCGAGVVGRVRRFRFDMKNPGWMWKAGAAGTAGSGKAAGGRDDAGDAAEGKAAKGKKAKGKAAKKEVAAQDAAGAENKKKFSKLRKPKTPKQ